MQKNLKGAKNSLIFGFSVSLFVLLLSSIVSYFSITQLVESQRWVEHTSQVSSSLDNLISLMKDAETGQRGFLLTGDDTFLEPYIGSKNKVMDLYMDAQQLTRENQTQQRDFPMLENLINEKYKIIEGTIADKKRGVLPEVKTLIRGKAIMDSIRTVIHVMNNREEKLMIVRNAKMNKFETLTPVFIGVAALLGMLITLYFYRKIQENSAIALILEKELSDKQRTIERQIEVISTVASKISAGDYDVRIKEGDLD